MSNGHPHPNRRASKPEPEPVLAAGAICWRPAGGGPAGRSGSGGAADGSSSSSRPALDGGPIPTQSDDLELLLVRSARWGDWSWPKGKLDPGETLPECAVREVAEETGAQIELGVPLPSVRYLMPDGIEKKVSYWAGRVRSDGPRTALAEEISHVEWLPVAAALDRLTRPSDVVAVNELLALADAGRLATRPLLIVRHAKARSRSHWRGAEADRTLTSAGRRQARGLAGLLACWQPERLLSSPWARCLQTLQPYLDAQSSSSSPSSSSSGGEGNDEGNGGGGGGPKPEVLPLLSEQGLRNDPSRISALIAELLTIDQSALLCTHRPVLEVVLGALARGAEPDARKHLPTSDPWLDPAEVLLAHIGIDQRSPTGKVIQVVERHGAERRRKRPS